MANDDRDQNKIASLFAWRRLLNEERAKAQLSARDAVARMVDAKLFHPSEITRYYNQMMNGSAVPSDFAPGQYGRITVA